MLHSILRFTCLTYLSFATQHFRFIERSKFGAKQFDLLLSQCSRVYREILGVYGQRGNIFTARRAKALAVVSLGIVNRRLPIS